MNKLHKINSYKTYKANVEIFIDDGSVNISLEKIDLEKAVGLGCPPWTDEEAEKDARELLRENGIDDTTADHYLISLIANKFPRA